MSGALASGIAAWAAARVAWPGFWLSRRLNPHSPAQAFDRVRDTMAFRLDMLAQNAMGRSVLRDRWVSALRPRPGAIRPVEVGAVGPSLKSDLHRQVPLHFPGLLRDAPGFAPWDFERFIDQHGDATVTLACPVLDGYAGPLRDVDVPGVYLHNSESLLQEHPDLVTSAGFEHVRDTAASPLVYLAVTQLFAGRAGTGSRWHCAGAMNMFFMLHGKKRWRFIDPAESPLLLPRTDGDGRSAYFYAEHAAASGKFEAEAEMLGVDPHALGDLDPLFQSTTRYEVDLEPGDVLFSPAWWWHDVENITDTTIGMASRWGLPGRTIANPTFDLGMHLNIGFYAKLIRANLDYRFGGTQTPVLERATRLVPTAADLGREANVAAYYARFGVEREKPFDA